MNNLILLTRRIALIKKIPIHIIVASSSWISKIIISLLQIYVTKVVIEILGVEKYSVFAILTGLMGWFLLLDFGIGQSLQNHISEYRARGKEHVEIINITLIFMTFVSLFLISILYFLSPFLSSIILKLFPYFDLNNKSRLFFITGCFFILSNIGNVIYKVLYALDKGYIANILPALSYLTSASLIYIFRDSLIKASNNLEYLLVIFLFPNVIFPILIWFFFLDFRIIFNFKKMKNILEKALHFWIFALLASLVLQIDYLVLSQYSNPKDIVIYNILSKIYLLGYFVYNALLISTWPFFTYNITKKNISLIIKYTKRYLKIGLIYMFIFSLFVSLFIKDISYFFLSDSSVVISASLSLLFGFYYLLRVWTDTFAVILQSANIIKPFLIYVPIQALISIFFQVILVKKYGLYGIVFGLIISFLSTVFWALPRYVNIKVFNGG